MPTPGSCAEEPDHVAAMLAGAALDAAERATAARPGRTTSPPGLRVADLPAVLRERAGRRGSPLAREGSGRGATSDAPRSSTEPTSGSIAPDSIARQTILEADREIRQVVQDASRRIAAVGARTRALLEASPPIDADAAAPAPSHGQPAATSTAHEPRRYEGAVTIQAGPFADIAQLNAFERALSSIPGIDDVYIRTFERHHAHFELCVVQPTPLIAELQARAVDSLRVIDAGERDIRLEIVTAETQERMQR